MYQAGGGTVTIPAGKTFRTGNIVVKSNVTLHFEDGATLKQSLKRNDFVKPVGDSYEPYQPKYGHNSMEGVEWGHTWYETYPLVYAGEGTENIKITGKGIIDMSPGPGCDQTLHMCPLGLYRVSNFEISDITIQNYSTYAMMPYTCNNGLIQNVTVKDYRCANGDGISMMNCQDMRITGCDLTTGDDSLYIFTSYRDPRGGSWWSSDDPQPSKNIEIDHNRCYVEYLEAKGFGMILWGADCPDLSRVEVSNVYVHDNTFNIMGIWNSDPFRDVGGPTPVKNIRFENNDIGKIQDNFYATPITDMNLYACTTTMHNGDFERTGEAYWTLKGNANPASAGAGNDDAGQQGSYYGFIDHLDEGDAKIYQGLNLKAGQVYQFRATVQSSGDPCRLFVRDLDTQELIAEKEFSNTEWAQTQLEFAVPRTGNYHIGMERGNAAKGWARMDSADVLCDWNEQTIYTTQVPTDFQKDAQCELGTRFQAKTSGLITRVRIYTNKEESGIHTVRIWDFDKKELVAGPFEWEVPSGREGWQIFTLPKAVRIEADQDYVVAVSSSAEQSYYAYGTGENSFAAPICNRDLITYTGSGLYSATLGAMPDQVQEDTLNYFRDIVFVSDEQTIFTTQEPSAFDNAAQYELGTRFQAKTSGSITKVRIYTSADESGIHTVRLWDYDAQEIIAGPFEWDVASGAEGWQEFVLPEAVKIEANKDYMVAVSNSTDRLYPLGQVESSFTAPICNRDLITYVGSGTYTTALGAMPTSVHAPYYINYFRDVVFVADPWTLGDVNNDGNIDATDALMALQHLVDLRKLEGNAWKAADVNADGKIDATDALLILQKLVGLIDEFPNNP